MPRILDLTRKPETEDVPLVSSGRRALTIQRLQIGTTGIALMILLVALASIVRDRADTTDQTAVRGATAAVEPAGAATQADPLVEAGVVPGLIVDPSETPRGESEPVAR